MPQLETLSLTSLKGGAAVERFDDELQRVLDNIVDPNTDGGTRSVTLKVTFKPNDNRDQCGVTIACTSKLGSSKPVASHVFVGRSADGVVASEMADPRQMQMELDAKKSATITTLKVAQ